jgi:site-specific DNA-methyltransferase (adenine-specific)
VRNRNPEEARGNQSPSDKEPQPGSQGNLSWLDSRASMGREFVMSDLLFQGDCLVEMRQILRGSVDMVLADLPYGTTRNEWDSQIDLNPFWDMVKTIRKPSCPIILFGQGMFSAELMFSNPTEWRYNLVWEKDRPSGFLNANKMPLRSHEDILVFYDAPPTYNPQKWEGLNKNHGLQTKDYRNRSYGEAAHVDNSETLGTSKYPRSVLYFPSPHPKIHPTQKPIELLEYLIATYTNEGATVLDPCMGIGSTGIACRRQRRGFIGIESDPHYFHLADNSLRGMLA